MARIVLFAEKYIIRSWSPLFDPEVLLTTIELKGRHELLKQKFLKPDPLPELCYFVYTGYDSSGRYDEAWYLAKLIECVRNQAERFIALVPDMGDHEPEMFLKALKEAGLNDIDVVDPYKVPIAHLKVFQVKD